MKYYLTAEEQALALLVFPEEESQILRLGQSVSPEKQKNTVGFLSKLKQKYNIFSLR